MQEYTVIGSKDLPTENELKNKKGKIKLEHGSAKTEENKSSERSGIMHEVPGPEVDSSLEYMSQSRIA